MNPYPLKLRPYYKDVIWGGSGLKRLFKKEIPTNTTGESWELCAREGYDCVIDNGEYQSMTLREYLTSCGENPDEFPLLIKFIDAKQNLSVQLHESKTEMWYIIDAARGAKLVYGLNDEATPESLFSAVESGTAKQIESQLKYVTVHSGEVYFIPTGLVHAIGEGIILAEIQQNDDSTYRIYDYNRALPDGSLRELHIEEAKKAIKPISDAKIYAQRYLRGRITERTLVNCEPFCVERHTIRTSLTQENPSYTHILCIYGDGEVSGVPFKQGEGILIPKGIDSFTVKANRPITVLISRAY